MLKLENVSVLRHLTTLSKYLKNEKKYLIFESAVVYGPLIAQLFSNLTYLEFVTVSKIPMQCILGHSV